MSKVSTIDRPDPGYENMDHFCVNVDYVSEMLRTIEFCSSMYKGRYQKEKENILWVGGRG